MTTPLGFASSIFTNAAHFAVSYRNLPSFPPVDAISTETSRWFAQLEDTDGDAVALKQRLWRLRTAVQLTLLPFESTDLSLNNECQDIARLARTYPGLAPRGEYLCTLVEQLVASGENPKRTAVFDLIGEDSGSTGRVGLVGMLARGRVPGWSPALLQDLRAQFPRLELIASRSDLERRAFDRVILPSGGRLCPLTNDLHFSGYTAALDVVSYKTETRIFPQRPSLPNGTLKKEHGKQLSQGVDPIDHGVTEFAGDTWIQVRFWDSAREGAIPDGDYRAEGAIMVQARLVILANNKKTFLEDASKIIEVSEILAGGRLSGQAVRKLPRRRVSDLREGHIVALRTSRSGSYLLSVADALLRSARKANLREEALDWKPYLHEALVAHGSARIAALLRERHHEVAHSWYVEVWATDRVIGPESESLFTDLISILHRLGALPEGTEPGQYGNLRWGQMRELIHFHLLAGIEIRKALLKELGRIIEAGDEIVDEMHVTLPGVDAGTLSLYRVTDVDRQTVEVPHTILEVVRDL